jgi:hypothetical protein
MGPETYTLSGDSIVVGSKECFSQIHVRALIILERWLITLFKKMRGVHVGEGEIKT